jgi:uncharacterized damage-inducible protein DinB
LQTANELLRQLIEGHDFEPVARMIGDLTPEQALVKREGWPYSIAENAGHTLYWQKLWLDGINERATKRARGKNVDWPAVSATEWPAVQAELLAGLQAAHAKSQGAGDLLRKLAHGETVEQVLLRIALHASYHIGQIALLRQVLGSWPPAGGSDSW